MKYTTKHSPADVLNILSQNVCKSGVMNFDRKKLFKGEIEGSTFSLKYISWDGRAPIPTVKGTITNGDVHTQIEIEVQTKKVKYIGIAMLCLMTTIFTVQFISDNNWFGAPFIYVFILGIGVIHFSRLKHYKEKSIEVLESLLELEK